MKTRTDWIREMLERNFDAPAQEIASKLQAKGVIIDPQHVYQVRSTMRLESKKEEEMARRRTQASVQTRQANTKTLAEHIIDVLYDHPDGLTDHQLLQKVVAAGYKTNATDALDVFRKKLYELVQRGRITKIGLPQAREYRLADGERVNIRTSRNQQGVVLQPDPPVPPVLAEPATPPAAIVQQPEAVVATASPAINTQPPVPENNAPTLLNPDLLMETLALVKKAGGIDSLKPYFDMVRRLS